jgi:hypothetical protein
MKKFILSEYGKDLGVSLLIMLLWGAAGFALCASQEKTDPPQEPIVEQVTVTNVEVPVRVLYKGKPVTDLSKEDFTLYENKKKMEINGFFLKRKKINVTTRAEAPGEPVTPLPPRTFVLVFSITDYNEYIEKAAEHLFTSILKPDDRVLIFANSKTMEYPQLGKREAIKHRLLADLKEESRSARRKLIDYLNKIEAYLNMHEFRVQLHKQDNRGENLVNFLQKYLVIWNEYKKRYLTPRLDRFYFFSHYLEKLKGDKWVLNFYQFDLFPNIRLSSNAMNSLRDLASRLIDSREAGANALGKMIITLLNQIVIDLNVSKDFPTEEVSKLFYKVDATFHSFFIRTMNKAGLDEMEYQEVSSEIEKTLKQITEITGGQNITSNNLVKSIDIVAEAEDAYYILTYVPQEPEKAGKIKIKVNEKKYSVLYDNNFRLDYISDTLKQMEEKIKTPDIKIEGFSFQGKVLVFTVKDYLVKKLEKENVGRMKVRIRLAAGDNPSLIFDQEKQLTAQKAEMKISLAAFKELKTGEYNFLIDATDLFTGKEAKGNYNITVKH